MRKLNSLFGQNAQLSALAQQIQEKELLNKLWLLATPPELSTTSHAYQLDDGLLTVYADNGTIASKIKFTQASLLKALENCCQQDNNFSQCKVTAIKVKVQVKSTIRPKQTRAITLSSTAAQQLNQLVDQLGESKLATILSRLASKHHNK
jgi:hypothetical protein